MNFRQMRGGHSFATVINSSHFTIHVVGIFIGQGAKAPLAPMKLRQWSRPGPLTSGSSTDPTCGASSTNPASAATPRALRRHGACAAARGNPSPASRAPCRPAPPGSSATKCPTSASRPSLPASPRGQDLTSAASRAPAPWRRSPVGLWLSQGGCLTSQEHQLHRYTDLGLHFMHLQILCIVATSPCSIPTATVPLPLPGRWCRRYWAHYPRFTVLVLSDWSEPSFWVAREVMTHPSRLWNGAIGRLRSSGP